jgi:hypothetical protein
MSHFHEQMAFNLKPYKVYQQGIKVAIKKYAVEGGFKWIGFRPGELDGLLLMYGVGSMY